MRKPSRAMARDGGMRQLRHRNGRRALAGLTVAVCGGIVACSALFGLLAQQNRRATPCGLSYIRISGYS